MRHNVYCVRIGTSIVVETERSSSVYNKLINNPQCFIIYNTAETPFTEITDVSSSVIYMTSDNNHTCHFLSQLNFTFIDNEALEATVIYMLSAVQCTWIGNHPPYFEAGSVLSWPFLNIR